MPIVRPKFVKYNIGGFLFVKFGGSTWSPSGERRRSTVILKSKKNATCWCFKERSAFGKKKKNKKKVVEEEELVSKQTIYSMD